MRIEIQQISVQSHALLMSSEILLGKHLQLHQPAVKSPHPPLLINLICVKMWKTEQFQTNTSNPCYSVYPDLLRHF